jgi:hypothetical protein
MDAQSTAKAIDRVIARLQQLRRSLVTESITEVPRPEIHGRYIHAPVWPWLAAGWMLGALFVLLFLVAWTYWRT